MTNTVKLILSLIIIIGIGLSGGLFTANEINTWFVQVNKPSWNPPNWLFGPVWTVLYVLMAIAFYTIWKSKPESRQKNLAMVLFAAQLLFNFCWSIIFFRLHNIELAFYDILLLWICIVLTIFAFGKISGVAAWLMVPYISWVTFATLLNGAIWKLN